MQKQESKILDRTTEKNEHRTSNVQHRILNDEIAPARHHEPYSMLFVFLLSRSGEAGGSLRQFINWQNTLFDVGRSMFDVRRSSLSGSHAPAWEPIWYAFPRWSMGTRERKGEEVRSRTSRKGAKAQRKEIKKSFGNSIKTLRLCAFA